MSYQNPTQEHYGADDGTSQQQHLLNPNVGIPNSSRGEGTTLSEISSKLRFLNCSASLFVILFHSLPRILNPIRLAVLLASPIQLISEVVLACCALSLLLVEARIPMLGLKALEIVRRGSKIDLDTARGRVVMLVIMAGSCGLIQYLLFVSKHGDGGRDSSPQSDSTHESNDYMPAGNITSFNNTTSFNKTMNTMSPINNYDGNKHQTSILSLLIQSTIVSPTMWVLISLVIYTTYVMQTYPDYVHSRAHPEPSLVHNSSINTQNRSVGYQNSGIPSWAQPAV
jgi:hypothetical protein